MDSKTIKLLSKTVIRLPISLNRRPGECVDVQCGTYRDGFISLHSKINQDHTWGTQDELEEGWFLTEISCNKLVGTFRDTISYGRKFIEVVKLELLCKLGTTSWFCYCLERLLSQLSSDTDDRNRILGYKEVLKSDKRELEYKVSDIVNRYNTTSGLPTTVTLKITNDEERF